METTINSIEYVGTTEDEITSPVGAKSTTSTDVDSIVVHFSVADVKKHPLWFKPEAISNRAGVYGLENDLHAIEALVREVVFGWYHLEPQGETKPEISGGADRRIAVKWGTGAKKAARSLLSDHADRLKR